MDHKNPLLLSEEKLSRTLLRLLQLCGIQANGIRSFLAIKQEFCLVDRSLFLHRLDLMTTGRTVFGAKGAGIREEGRVEAFLRDVEVAAGRLGISVKAPFERASVACEHNALLMELLREVAVKQGLACLVDQSVKRCRWSLMTDSGFNLLEGDSLACVILHAAIERAVQEHAPLMHATGHAGEFFVVRGSVDCALPVAVLNAVVADRLQLMLDEIADVVQDRKLSSEELFGVVRPVLQKHEWGGGELQRGCHPFEPLIDKKTVRLFEGVLSEEDLHGLYEFFLEQYVKAKNREADLMIEMFQNQILPVLQGDAHPAIEEIQKFQAQIGDMGWEGKAKVFCELIVPKMSELRKAVDHLETTVDNWPLPKYREIL